MKITHLKSGGVVIQLERGSAFQNFSDLREKIATNLGVDSNEFYLTRQSDGKLFNGDEHVSASQENGDVLIVHPRLFGGKGGFGSMLRAIGAQIEKTTNRDACRDLSGRRLRDINEEQRLKRWFAKQKEREEEKVEARKTKLEKLKKFTEGPALPKIDDPEYNQQRADMAESVYAAVDKGFEHVNKPGTSASATSTSATTSSGDESSSDGINKDKGLTEIPSSSSSSSAATVTTSSASVDAQPPAKKKIFKKTMMDEDLDSSTSSDESDEESAPKKAKIAN